MNESYRIEISIIPDVETSPQKPYYWRLCKHIEGSSDWLVEDYNWAITPEKAWEEARATSKLI